jgi:proline iminopeptidase
MKKIVLALLLIVSIKGFAQDEYFITSPDQTKLRVREFGTGEPLILLAGGPGLNADYLDPLWTKLSLNFRCIVIDQRGTGKSMVSSADSTSMSMANYINDLEALQEHLNLKEITVIGHSWGGMLAMEYTANRPNKVRELILIGPGGPSGKFLSYFGDNIGMRLHESDLQEIALLDSMNKSNLPAIWPGYFFDRNMALKSKPTIDFDAIRGQPGVNKYTISNYIALDARRTDLLRNYRGMIHIIQGRQDPIGESTIYEIKDILPQAQIHFIEKCGHFPWLENETQQTEFWDTLYEALD